MALSPWSFDAHILGRETRPGNQPICEVAAKTGSKQERESLPGRQVASILRREHEGAKPQAA